MMIKDLKLRLGASSDSLQIRHQLAQLCQRDAHSAPGRMKQHSLAALNSAQLEQQDIRSQVAIGQSGCLAEADLWRDLVD